jgi:hypothetical protein
MPEMIEKASLLDKVQVAYSQFEALLTSLSQQQMTTPGVNAAWSVKDNIAHLTVWQDYMSSRLQGLLEGKLSMPEFMPQFTNEDEVNEYFYQQDKDRALAEVLAAFRASYQRVLAAVQAVEEQVLNAPIPWSKSDRPVWAAIAGNTYEHYEEHGDIIRRWLAGVR